MRTSPSSLPLRLETVFFATRRLSRLTPALLLVLALSSAYGYPINALALAFGLPPTPTAHRGSTGTTTGGTFTQPHPRPPSSTSTMTILGATIRTSRAGGRDPSDPFSLLRLRATSSTTGTADTGGGGEEATAKSASARGEKRPGGIRRRARKNDVVTLDYTLTPSDPLVEGDDYAIEPLFDCSGVVSFVLGGGNYLPGLHDLLMGMEEGESVTNVTIDAGWGSHNPKLVATVSKDTFGDMADTIRVGSELWLQSGHKCFVTEVLEDECVIDCNPPLAGATYDCNLTLLRVEEGPDSLNGGSGEVDRISSPADGDDTASETDSEGGRPEEETTTSRAVKNGSFGDSRFKVATFGLGCFWGGELAFMRERGVVGTQVGYSQGQTPEPTYEEVCSETTGHVEALRVVYDPAVVSYDRLVELAMERLGDDVYQVDQVGNDVGSQYRSGIYYHDEEQWAVAKKILAKFGEGCQTELEPADETFWRAEEYHQQYLLKGGQSAKKGATENIRCYG